MSMNDVHSFSDVNVPQKWQIAKYTNPSSLIVQNRIWNIVNFEAIDKISNALSISISMSDNDDFMA